MNEVEVIEFEEKYAKDFADLNYEWIEKFFEIEDIDRKYLENPKEMIVDKGGAILLARYNNRIVGTVSLLDLGNGVFELAKMSVHPDLRGKKIGHLIMDACIEKARVLGANQILILSSRKLKNALHLYEKYGFKDVGNEDDDYHRCDIRMTLDL
ncbi:MAG: GNAT family N-acetyltransferase [Bacteroidota bacterium]